MENLKKMDLTIMVLQMLKSMIKEEEDRIKQDHHIAKFSVSNKGGETITINWECFLADGVKNERTIYSVEICPDHEKFSLIRLKEHRDIRSDYKPLKYSEKEYRYLRENIQRIREYQVLPTNAVIGYGATKRQVITEDTIGTGSDIIRYYRQLEDMDGQVEKQEFSLFPDSNVETILADVEANFHQDGTNQKVKK